MLYFWSVRKCATAEWLRIFSEDSHCTPAEAAVYGHAIQKMSMQQC